MSLSTQQTTQHLVTTTATLNLNPTAGDLIVVAAGSRSGMSHADFGISDNRSQEWTKRVGRDTDLGGSTKRCMAFWTAQSTVTNSMQVQITGDGNWLSACLYVVRDTAVQDWNFRAESDNDSSTTGVTSLSTGTTSSVSAGELAILGNLLSYSNFGPGAFSWTNSLTDILNLGGGGSELSFGQGFYYDTAGGAWETTPSWSGSFVASSSIVVMEAGGAAGGDPVYEATDFRIYDDDGTGLGEAA